MPKRLVYLDNAATTPVRPEVLEAMLPYLGRDAFGNPSSAHRFGRAARAGIEEAKRTIATALDADPGQVIFTSGGTEADNLALIGCALAASGGARPSGSPYRRSSTRRSLARRTPSPGWAARKSSCRSTAPEPWRWTPWTPRSPAASPW